MAINNMSCPGYTGPGPTNNVPPVWMPTQLLMIAPGCYIQVPFCSSNQCTTRDQNVVALVRGESPPFLPNVTADCDAP